MTQQINHIYERVLVSNLLFGAIGASSRNMDVFSSWLIAGFAAVAAGIFANLGQVAHHLTPHVLHTFFICFFVTVVLGIVEKLLAVLVTGASAGAAIGRTEGTYAAESRLELDIPFLFSEVERAVIWPARWFMKRSFAKAAKGDLSASARSFTRVVQIQGLCMFAQALVVLWVVGVVACGATF
ncbi:MAG: hypothetical protein WB819_01030 [Terriglobia bacterium]